MSKPTIKLGDTIVEFEENNPKRMMLSDFDRTYYGTGREPERLPEPIPPERQIYRGEPRNRHERRAMKKQRSR